MTETYKAALCTVTLDVAAGTVVLEHSKLARPRLRRASPVSIDLASVTSVSRVRHRGTLHIVIETGSPRPPSLDDPQAFAPSMRSPDDFVGLLRGACPQLDPADERAASRPSRKPSAALLREVEAASAARGVAGREADRPAEMRRGKAPKKPGFWSWFDSTSNNSW